MDLQSVLTGVRDFFVFGLKPNKPSLDAGDVVEDNDGYKLAIIEFDDQGICFDRGTAIDGLSATLEDHKSQNPIIVVFVHGWKHNAQSGDDNLLHFRDLLAHTAAGNDSPRPVIGVYLAWKGLSRYGNLIWLNSSFWGRQKAAERVAQGTVREVLGRLKAFRNGPPGANSKPQATLAIIGHSFGGLIVYTAIAQSLIEAAASPEKTVPSFGDLVLLVNPALSAVSYMPIWTIKRAKDADRDQLPVCVSVTATNDWATGWTYPIGAYLGRFAERCRGREREALTHTMGHLPWMRTHELKIADPTANKDAAEAASPDDVRQRRGVAQQALRELSKGTSQTFGGVTVSLAKDAEPTPFWVASAPPEIIDGHNGIFKEAFIAFARGLIGAHIKETADKNDAAA